MHLCLLLRLHLYIELLAPAHILRAAPAPSSPSLADQFASSERFFRAGAWSPYGANIAFVLNEDAATAAAERAKADLDLSDSRWWASDAGEKLLAAYSLSVLVNEDEVLLPGCDGEQRCPLLKFLAAHKERIGCDRRRVCRLGGGSGGDKAESESVASLRAAAVREAKGLPTQLHIHGGL